MRTEYSEHTSGSLLLRSRRNAARVRIALEPRAVDAAMEDESLPTAVDCGSRIDAASRSTAGMSHARSDDASNSALLESLAEQLDLLHEQQREIRQLLDRAGRVRIDAANV